jgi:hypothetical protein
MSTPTKNYLTCEVAPDSCVATILGSPRQLRAMLRDALFPGHPSRHWESARGRVHVVLPVTDVAAVLPEVCFQDAISSLRSVPPESVGTIVILQVSELMKTPYCDTVVDSFHVPAVGAALYSEEMRELQRSLPLTLAWLSCALCQKRPTLHVRLKRCARCQQTRYCGVEHQREHWPVHKLDCHRIICFQSLLDQWREQE